MVKKIVLLFSIMTLSSAVFARDDVRYVSIDEALSTADAQSILSQGIELYWGNQSYATPTARFGEFTSNKKTNAVNKSDLGSCYWVFLSAVRSLQDRAYKEGGNAVVNIVSYYKKKEYSSESQYECHAGNVITGVTLRGDVVTLP